jgi:rhodanese-related sulfurtransferase
MRIGFFIFRFDSMIKKVLLLAVLLAMLLAGVFVFMKDWAFDKLVRGIISSKVQSVQPHEVELDKYLILDARSREEYEVSHLPNAVWVGYKDFELSRIPNSNKPILVYCSLGKRSGEIGEKLQEAWHAEVHNLYGGIFKWVNQGNTVVNTSGETQKVHVYSKAWGIWLNRGEKVY